MRVADFKKRVRRTTEKAFEDLVADAWACQGIWSRHMSDRFSGVPDRYIAGGKWVELKSLEYARGDVPYGAGMSVEQRRVCGELIEKGDEVWYMALVTTSRGQFVIWCPMWAVLQQKDNVWGLHDGGDYGWFYPYEGKKSVIEHIPGDWLL